MPIRAISWKESTRVMAAKKFTVEAGLIRLFAQALGDTNPVYYEETAADTDMGGIIAPPTFIRASVHWDPNYRFRWQPGKPWHGSGPTDGSRPKGTGGTGLHAEEHYEYYRPLRPGDVLISTSRPGNTWTKEGRRGGIMHFSEIITEWRDQADELVLTSRSVHVETGRIVSREEGE